MSEVELMRAIQMKASDMGHRLFRNNVGTGWVGQQVRVSQPTMVMMAPGDVLVRKASPLHSGLCVGSSDLIGLTKIGLFLAVEVKAPKGRFQPNQPSFIEQVRGMGGIGIVARTLEDFKV